MGGKFIATQFIRIYIFKKVWGKNVKGKFFNLSRRNFILLIFIFNLSRPNLVFYFKISFLKMVQDKIIIEIIFLKMVRGKLIKVDVKIYRKLGLKNDAKNRFIND
jgi:uncharacterized integral membrane protein